MACENKNGQVCLTSSNYSSCGLWQITQDNINCLAQDLLAESIMIAGADINIFKLLGIHEQSRLINDLGTGSAFSNGDQKGFPAENAFSVYKNEWRSKQTGSAIIPNSFIGYDYGVKKLENGRVRYGIEANERRHITTLKIKQSDDERYRVSKARLERSDDNITWYGVDTITFINNSDLNQYNVKHSAPSRYWRLRPLSMVSGNLCIRWGIQAIELSEYSKTNIDNIQDKLLLENRDRDYGNSITLKGYYELLTIASELTRFGIEIPDATYQIKIPFISCVSVINRPIIIGDIVELPSEIQYNTKMEPIKRYLEVTDVTWDSSSYTPGWKPTTLLLTAKPAMASEETQDIFGSLVEEVDTLGLVNNGQTSSNWQDMRDIDHFIKNESNTRMSERGSDMSNEIRLFSDEEIAQAKDLKIAQLDKMNYNPNSTYLEDAMPPNGESFTESDSWPTNPEDGDYHRLTYSNLDDEYPTRLYRYSVKKQQWIYLETDKRFKYNEQKSYLKEFL